MALTKLRVTTGGVPLPHVQVLAGEVIQTWVDTGETGIIEIDLADNYCAILKVAFRHTAFPSDYTATLILEPGGDYIFEKPI
jgi:hypothetical protein